MQRKDSFSDKNESGVSEAIGFVIMFSIVLTGIAMVTLYGYPLLLESQISSDERTMEQTMISLQNDIKILSYSNVPYRDAAIRVSGGYLEVIDSDDSDDSFLFEYTNTLFAADSYDFKPGELRYTSGEGTAVFSIENGAVLSRPKYQSGSVMIAEPRWYYDDSTDTLVVLLTKISADKNYALGGIGNVQMSMLTEPLTTNENYALNAMPPQTITLTYTPDPSNDLSVAWKNYLTGDSIPGGHFTEISTNKYDITGVSRLVIKEYTVNIESL